MRKTFQKWTGLQASEETRTTPGLPRPIQGQDLMQQLSLAPLLWEHKEMTHDRREI